MHFDGESGEMLGKQTDNTVVIFGRPVLVGFGERVSEDGSRHK